VKQQGHAKANLSGTNRIIRALSTFCVRPPSAASTNKQAMLTATDCSTNMEAPQVGEAMRSPLMLLLLLSSCTSACSLLEQHTSLPSNAALHCATQHFIALHCVTSSDILEAHLATIAVHDPSTCTRSCAYRSASTQPRRRRPFPRASLV
jgi:hypothetical protein